MDTARRQLRHDLLPQHRRHFVAVEPVENSTGLLRVDHLAVELARFVDRGLNRLLGDLVEHNAFDRYLRVQNLNEMPSNRLALAILIRCEVQLVGFLQERLQEPDVVLLVTVLYVERLEAIVDVNTRPGPLLRLICLRHIGRIAREVTDMADGRLHGVSVAEILGNFLGFRRGFDDNEGIGHGGEPNRSLRRLSTVSDKQCANLLHGRIAHNVG